MFKHCARLAIGLTLAVTIPTGALAQPDQESVENNRALALWIAHTESDNVSRVAGAGRERGPYDSLGLLLDIGRTSNRLRAGLATDIEFRQYSEERLDDERVGTANAFADIDVVPERFTWSFREDLSQGQTDPLVALGPENRETISVFSSGPDVNLPLGRRTRLGLGGRYSRRKYGDSELLDSDSIVREVGVYRDIGRVATVGLVADRNEIKYDVDLPGYDIEAVRLRYDKQLASGDVLAELGRTKLTSGEQESTGPLVRLTWSRGLSARSRLAISLSREFTDAGVEFGRSSRQRLVVEPTDVLLTASPAEQKRAEVRYDFTSPRTQMTVGLASLEDDFDGDFALDSDGESVRFTISRSVTSRLRLGASWEKVQRDYVNLVREDRDTSTAITLDRQLGRRLSVQGLLADYERTGLYALDERRYEVRIQYEPGR